jgi:Flp pilus assembly protein TadD
MNRNKIALLAGLCLLGACSSTQTSSQAALSVEPVMRITDASTPQSQYRLGRYYQGQNRFDQAATAYRRALALDANYSEAHNALGVLYSRQQQYPEAVAEFTAALQSAPEAAHIHNNLGYTYYLQGEYDKAIAALRQAVALDVASVRARNNLEMAYAKLETGAPLVVARQDEVAQQAEPVPQAVQETAAPPESALPVAGVPDAKPVMQESRGVIVRQTRPLEVTVVQVAPPVYALQRVSQNTVAVTPMSVPAKLEISNGNGVEGLARRVGAHLRESGYASARLTNQKPFNVGVSQIQYRHGYEEAAEKLRAVVTGRVALVASENLRSDIALKLLLGKDFSLQPPVFAQKTGEAGKGREKG